MFLELEMRSGQNWVLRHWYTGLGCTYQDCETYRLSESGKNSVLQ